MTQLFPTTEKTLRFLLFACCLILGSSSFQPQHRAIGQDVTFSPSTERLSTGESVELVEFKKPFLYSLRYSPTGSELGIIFRFGPPIIVDAKSWTIQRQLPGLRAIAFSPDGQVLATAEGKDGARLWNRNDPAVSTKFLEPASSDVVRDVAYSPSGKLVATAHDSGVIRVWDANNSQKLKDFPAHSGPVLCLTFAKDGKSLYSGGSDATIRVWDTNAWNSVKVVNGPKSNAVIALCVSSDGSALASINGKIGAMVWDTQTWKASMHAGYISVAAANQSKLFALGGKDVLLTNGSRSSEQRLKLGDPAKPVGITAVEFTPDDQKLATGNMLGELRVISLK